MQNADDNRYLPGVVPTVIWWKERHPRRCITVFNNEIGVGPLHRAAVPSIKLTFPSGISGYSIGQSERYTKRLEFSSFGSNLETVRIPLGQFREAG